jgi:hypothetical protein
MLIACASEKEKQLRKISSVTQKKPAIYDHSRSMVNIFPALSANNGIWYYFYVALRPGILLEDL